MHPSPNSNQQYRKDIDGLRALAVLLVILCHMEITYFSGGFIGVDVFFVISGFLITKIIYREIQDGSFSFQSFYSRRIKRLLPALIVVLGVTCFAFSWILSPIDLQKFVSSMAWVMLFVGNVYFWIHHGGYFESNAKEAPLLHTWSLAIEEQFYFVWPVVLIIAVRFLPTKFFPWIVVAALAVLVYLSELALNISAAASYYLLPTRFFELLVGASLAVWWKLLPKPSLLFSSVASIGSLLLIFYFAMTLSEHSRFPGLNAFYVSAASALLIYCGQQSTNLGARLLSIKPAVFIGLISYSLYLWHWPILVWVKYRGFEITDLHLVLLFVLMILFAWSSWRYVEKPFRATSKPFSHLAMGWFVIPLVFIAVVNIGVMHWHGFPNRFNPQVAEIETALTSFSNEIRGECHSSFTNRAALPNDNCIVGDVAATRTGFLFGDSHANHFTGFFDVIGLNRGLKITDYTMDQCPPIFDIESGESSFRAKECEVRNENARDYIVNQSFDYVLLAASWPHYRSNKIYKDGILLTDANEIAQHVYQKLYSTIALIVSTGAKPIIIEDIAYAGANDPKCTLKNEMFSANKDCQINYHNNPMMMDIYDQLSPDFPNLIRVDAKDVYCDGKTCFAEIDGTPMYRDDDHINHVASELLGKLYLKENPLFLKTQE